MPRNPRIFIHNRYYEICFRTEQGLPLVCSPIIEALFKGIVAKAATLYPVTICKLMIMGNHVHLGLIVNDPEHVHKFICYLKRELAHAINKLLGRRRQTVWQEGYDAAIILDTAKAIERNVYVHLNPVRANLVETVSEYPGFSTWSIVKGGDRTLTAKRIPRSSIPTLPSRTLSKFEQKQIVETMLETATEEHTIEFLVDAWLNAVPDGGEYDTEKIRQKIINRVENNEKLISKKRDRPVLGIQTLRFQSMREAHTPRKFGKKMLCFGSTAEIRRPYIEWFKGRREEIAAMKNLFPFHEFVQKLPPGFFAPGGRLRTNLNPQLCLV